MCRGSSTAEHHTSDVEACGFESLLPAPWRQPSVTSIFSNRKRLTTPPTSVLPAGFTSAVTAVTEILTSMFTLISGIVFPETVTAVSALAAFGLIGGIILWVWSLIKKFSNG